MTAWYCKECGTVLKAKHWPDDDYRCPHGECKFFDVQIDSRRYIKISAEEETCP